VKKTILTLTVLLGIAAVLPLGAQAHPKRDHRLRITLKLPLNFAPTAECPTGAAIYGISVHGQTGSGTNCIGDSVPADCPPGVTAQFCQTVPARMTLSLDGSRIVGNVTIFEAWNCAATCVVDQRWSGTVTQASRRFHDLEHGSVSGGGLVVVDPATFEILSLDEVLTITATDDDHD
jgi:hypothetical protein